MAKNETTALAKVLPAEQPFLQEFAADLGTTSVALWAVAKQMCIKSGKDARPATTEELFVYLMVCKQHELNPFLKEAFGFIGQKGELCTGITIDGWLKIANRHPEMDGLETEAVYSESGKLKAYTATVWRKDRNKPFTVPELLDECYRDTLQWNTRPHRMLRHKAVIQAIRYAFAITGLSDIEEAQEAVRNADSIADIPTKHRLDMPKDIVGAVPWAAPAETKALVEGVGQAQMPETVGDAAFDKAPARIAQHKAEHPLVEKMAAEAEAQGDIVDAEFETEEPAEPDPIPPETERGDVQTNGKDDATNGSAGSGFDVKLAPGGTMLGPADAYECIAVVGDAMVSVGRHTTKPRKFWCAGCCDRKGLNTTKGESCPHLEAALEAERKAAGAEDLAGKGEEGKK